MTLEFGLLFLFFSFFVQKNREGMKITEMKQENETISYHIVLYKQQQINSFHWNIGQIEWKFLRASEKDRSSKEINVPQPEKR